MSKKKLFIPISFTVLLLWLFMWWYNPRGIFSAGARNRTLVLKHDERIGGKLYREGDWVFVDHRGNVRWVERRLEEDTVIQGTRLTKGTHIFLNPSRRFSGAELLQDQVIQGIKCAAGRVSFHESGRLKSCELSQDQEIQGKNFLKGSKVSFYESGKLWHVRLSKAQEVQGIEFPGEANVCYFGTDRVVEVRLELEEDWEIHGIKCSGGTSIGLHESGKLKHAVLSEDQEIQGRKLYKKDSVYFDEKENIVEFDRSLKEDTIIQATKFPQRSRIRFYGSGRLKSVLPSQDCEIHGITFPTWSTIYFYESGEVKAAQLSRACKIKGRRYSTDKVLIFDKDGNVSSVVYTTMNILKSIRNRRER